MRWWNSFLGGLKRVALCKEGGARAIWKLLFAYAAYLLWAWLITFLLSWGFGALFDAWSETFKMDAWKKAIESAGTDLNFYVHRERSLDELFPWDFIKIGVTKDFLKREWENAKQGKVTPNCREKCSGCGAAKFGGGVCYEG